MQGARGMTEAAGLASDAATGNLLGAAWRGMTWLMSEAGEFPPKVANEVQQILMSADPQQVQRAVQEMQRLEAAGNLTRERASKAFTLIMRGLAGSPSRWEQGAQQDG